MGGKISDEKLLLARCHNTRNDFNNEKPNPSYAFLRSLIMSRKDFDPIPKFYRTALAYLRHALRLPGGTLVHPLS